MNTALQRGPWGRDAIGRHFPAAVVMVYRVTRRHPTDAHKDERLGTVCGCGREVARRQAAAKWGGEPADYAVAPDCIRYLGEKPGPSPEPKAR
jgi:hypothetical protein